MSSSGVTGNRTSNIRRAANKKDNVHLGVPDLLKTIGERFQSSATVKNVLGDQISARDRTAIPVARVSYAFGGGRGGREGEEISDGGGGGRVSAVPAGVVEITPAGTHFISFVDWRKLASVVAISFAIGFFEERRRARS